LTRRPAAAVLVALAGTVAGCGHAKVQRSNQPVALPASTTTTSAPSAASTKSTKAKRTVDGTDIATKFGDVQVALVLKGHRIVDVRSLRLPFDRQRSAFISQQASPILRQEVLAAQSARINLVSGATYTSDAWATSVQSALSQAG
jgi:uncharacterized protein with FMN-binding domain